jgi:antitoxin (DNA-binding transcriptional repressor) of toxin-antitoxin stability system
MTIVTVQDLERDPQGFLHRIEAGESLTLVRGEQPIAEVRPIAPKTAEPRPFALCAGQFTVPADFDKPLPAEFLDQFEGP